MHDYLFIDYKEWEQLMNEFVSKLNRLAKISKIYQFTHIYAPPRGGLPVAVHLSHHLNLKMISDSHLFANKIVNDNNLLIVDDIVDTGKTFENIEKILKFTPINKYKLASVHYKSHSNIVPDIHLKQIPNDTWVVYPFECQATCDHDRIEFQKKRK